MSTELKKINILNKELIITQIFAPNGLDKIIEEIKEKARSIIQDMTTKKGRDEIKAMAYKIAKMKTSLDKAGKDLTEEWTQKTKLVNIERKKARDELDALKEEIRKPLTEWENKEKERVEFCENRIMRINSYKNHRNLPSEEYDRLICEVKILEKHNWEEFKTKAETITKETIEYLQSEYEKTLKAEKERMELEKLRKEKEERERKDHEEQIKKEEREKAEKEAKEREKEIKRKAKEKQEVIKKEKMEAEVKAKEQERLRKETEKKAKEDIEKAKIQAEKEKQEAIEQERKRVELEKKKEQEEIAKRKADLNHRKKINNEIVEDLSKIKFAEDEQHFKEIVIAIAKGKVRHLSIKY